MMVNDKIRVVATFSGDFSSFPLFFKGPSAGGVYMPPVLGAICSLQINVVMGHKL